MLKTHSFIDLDFISEAYQKLLNYQLLRFTIFGITFIQNTILITVYSITVYQGNLTSNFNSV